MSETDYNVHFFRKPMSQFVVESGQELGGKTLTFTDKGDYFSSQRSSSGNVEVFTAPLSAVKAGSLESQQPQKLKYTTKLEVQTDHIRQPTRSLWSDGPEPEPIVVDSFEFKVDENYPFGRAAEENSNVRLQSYRHRLADTEYYKGDLVSLEPVKGTTIVHSKGLPYVYDSSYQGSTFEVNCTAELQGQWFLNGELYVRAMPTALFSVKIDKPTQLSTQLPETTDN